MKLAQPAVQLARRSRSVNIMPACVLYALCTKFLAVIRLLLKNPWSKEARIVINYGRIQFVPETEKGLELQLTLHSNSGDWS